MARRIVRVKRKIPSSITIVTRGKRKTRKRRSSRKPRITRGRYCGSCLKTTRRKTTRRKTIKRRKPRR